MSTRYVTNEYAGSVVPPTLYLLPIICSLTAHADSSALPELHCSTSCVEIVDYESNESPLHYSRHRSVSSDTNAGTASRWRHDYEIRLTGDGDDRVIFDQHGQAHRFLQQEDGSFRAENENSGTLHDNNGSPMWTHASGVTTEFQGSWPTRVHFPDGQSLRLDYEKGRLHTISDQFGEQILIEHPEGSASRVHTPDGRITLLDTDPCFTPPTTTDSPSAPQQCDTQANPVAGFDEVALPPGATALDARPASCQSYFVDYYGTVRGEEIERGIAQLAPYNALIPTNRSYPIVDFIDDEELIVVRSRDLASPSFNDPQAPDALHQRLLRDGAQIQSRFLDPLNRDGVLSRTEQGRTTHIVQDPSQYVSLHLIIRQDMASPEHWRQIEQARTDLLQQYGIRLQVVIIP
ncbi:hypothetical protein ACUNV4_29610 [Granulosicoccus sp. 3-233]|uniref:hypothetical protein n=1 Tax=Granulosicoccus sp. 3-233 TaxID=3417969 RepID=UPI003D32D632